jgi:co-chaperonin GroES (HSP10)
MALPLEDITQLTELDRFKLHGSRFLISPEDKGGTKKTVHGIYVAPSRERGDFQTGQAVKTGDRHEFNEIKNLQVWKTHLFVYEKFDSIVLDGKTFHIVDDDDIVGFISPETTNE